jgi:hypothetical protein
MTYDEHMHCSSIVAQLREILLRFPSTRVTPSGSMSYDLEAARRLFDISAELTTLRLSAAKKAAAAAQKQPIVTSA